MGEPDPSSPAVVWYKGQRTIALLQSSVLYTLGWGVQALTSNDWTTWRALAIALLGNVVIQLRDWWNPNVIGPLPFMNKPAK